MVLNECNGVYSFVTFIFAFVKFLMNLFFRDLLIAYSSAVTGALGVALGLKYYFARVIYFFVFPYSFFTNG